MKKNIQEITFTMLKPDVSSDTKIVSEIIDQIMENGFSVMETKRLMMSREMVEEFYSEHKDRPFFKGLVDFMTSGEVLGIMLTKENGVMDLRKLIGATDPIEADPGTIRFRFAKSKSYNAIHGSDSLESAKREIHVIFS